HLPRQLRALLLAFFRELISRHAATEIRRLARHEFVTAVEHRSILELMQRDSFESKFWGLCAQRYRYGGPNHDLPDAGHDEPTSCADYLLSEGAMGARPGVSAPKSESIRRGISTQEYLS